MNPFLPIRSELSYRSFKCSFGRRDSWWMINKLNSFLFITRVHDSLSFPYMPSPGLITWLLQVLTSLHPGAPNQQPIFKPLTTCSSTSSWLQALHIPPPPQQGPLYAHTGSPMVGHPAFSLYPTRPQLLLMARGRGPSNLRGPSRRVIPNWGSPPAVQAGDKGPTPWEGLCPLVLPFSKPDRGLPPEGHVHQDPLLLPCWPGTRLPSAKPHSCSGHSLNRLFDEGSSHVSCSFKRRCQLSSTWLVLPAGSTKREDALSSSTAFIWCIFPLHPQQISLQLLQVVYLINMTGSPLKAPHRIHNSKNSFATLYFCVYVTNWCCCRSEKF